MTTSIEQRVQDILESGGPDEESRDDRTERIEALIPEYGWDAVGRCMFGLLRDESQKEHWREVVHVFWGAVLDRRTLPADELIAWLNYRFDPHGDAEENEVWSITSKLKGKRYLSKYKPLEDPDVLKHLRAIRGG
jgi:hypothetical protein